MLVINEKSKNSRENILGLEIKRENFKNLKIFLKKIFKNVPCLHLFQFFFFVYIF
jgi:hypothetical protein